jgi:hypothetical protein
MVINNHKAIFEVHRDAISQQEEQERLLEQALRLMKNALFQLLGSKLAVKYSIESAMIKAHD